MGAFTGASTLGYQQITSLSSAAGFTIPAGTARAIVIVESQPVRWRDDGTSPTSTVGMPMAVGDVLEYDGNMVKIKFIEVSSGAKLNITYYSA